MSKKLKSTFAVLATLSTLALSALTGCESAIPRKSDAELGLTPVQAAGRHIYDRQCGMCHEAYSSKPLKGPSLEGIFKKKYLKSGTPANDERVRDVITVGRAKMPAFSRTLSDQQIDELLAYLHTL